MLEGINDGTIFGICFCDVEVPTKMHEKFVEFPPLFVKVDKFNTNMIKGTMFDYVKSFNLTPPESFLTTKMSSTNSILPTEIVKYYLKEGFYVKNLTKVIQFEPGNKLFHKFLQDKVQERRNGEKKGGSVVSNMAKLSLNAAVGYTLLREEKLGKPRICDEKALKRAVRMNNILEIDYIGPTYHAKEYYAKKKEKCDTLYYISTEKENFTPSLPILIGYKVLAMAKYHMLKLFKRIRKYIDDEKIDFLYTDTDSAYFALSENTMDECVKPHLFEKWSEKKKHQMFVTNEKGTDKFTPLLLKLEASGKNFAALSPKTYVLCDGKDKIIKTASKGINFDLNENLITFERFTKALLHYQPPQSAEMRGIRNLPNNDGVFTYTQTRQFLSSLHVKRVVDNDLIHTYPLDYLPSYSNVNKNK